MATLRTTRMILPKAVTLLAASLISFGIGTVNPASAVISPNEQFVTDITGTISGPGDALNLTFGPSGVTGVYTVTTLSNASVTPFNSPLSGTNATTYLEPDPPPDSDRVVNSNALNGNITGTVTLSKPLPSLLLHVVNLDESTLTVSGTSTTGAPIQVVPEVKNDELEITGNLLNSTPQTALNTGCEVSGTGANPNGGCGSIRLTAASGLIQTFTLSNVNTGNGDGWQWTLSFTAINAICFGPPPAALAGFTTINVQPGVDTAGTAGNDLIIGTTGNDRIAALGGNDIIFGLGGNDKVSAGTGDDIVCGGPGDDWIAGDDGFDILDGGTGNDDISGGLKDDVLFGGPDNDRFAGDAGTDTCDRGGASNGGSDVAAVPSCELVI